MQFKVNRLHVRDQIYQQKVYTFNIRQLGATWNQVNYWPPTNNGYPGGSPLDMTVWNPVYRTIAFGCTNKFYSIRWIQSTSSSANYDNWGIDNVNIGDAISTSGNYTITWLHDNYSLATGVTSKTIQRQ